MNVIFLTMTDYLGASSRYRVYQYIPYLQEKGIRCIVCPAVSNRVFQRFNPDKGSIYKGIYFGSAVINRIVNLWAVKKADVLFIQRTAIPHVFPILEYLPAKISENVVFDFDDAIFINPPQIKKSVIYRGFRDVEAVPRLLRLSKKVIAGNHYLMNYAMRFNEDSVLIPTSIDIEIYQTRNYDNKQENKQIIIGWMGSPSTSYYLKSIEFALAHLAKKYPILLRVIGANIDLPGVPVECKPWYLNDEVDDLKSFDIGIMPLTNDKFAEGKCGAKLLQYMGVGVPGVASPVGINKEIIDDGINGFLASTNEEWYQKLERLIEEIKLRRSLGLAGRNTVEERYAVQKNVKLLHDVLIRAAGN